jgi:hypothetical protein
MPLSDATVAALRIDTVDLLAPAFRVQVLAIVRAMHDRGQPTRVMETLRLDRLQRHYFEVGTSQAQDAGYSWHGYGLAADLVHATRFWDAPPGFWAALGEEAERVGCAWGGRWKHPVDTPHVQFGPGMRVSPSDTARRLVVEGGVFAVWKAVGALRGFV